MDENFPSTKRWFDLFISRVLGTEKINLITENIVVFWDNF